MAGVLQPPMDPGGSSGCWPPVEAGGDEDGGVAVAPPPGLKVST